MCSSMEGMKGIPPLCSLFSVHVLQEGNLEIVQDKLTFSFENHSLLLSSLEVQEKAVGFLPSAWGKTKGAPIQLRHLTVR